MKKFALALAVLMILLNSACENKYENAIDPALSAPSPTFAQTQDDPILEPTLEKSGLVEIIRDVTFDMAVNDWEGYFIRRSDLPDPMQKKLQVLLTRLSNNNSNPNLYLYGYDEQTQAFRLIRSSTKPGNEVDLLSFRSTDLLNSEERIYVGAWAFNSAAFVQMTTLRRDVDCKEFPAAEQITTTLFQPVCGCDGQTYSNAARARAAGITRWRNGACN
jgi:hypothetical protein